MGNRGSLYVGILLITLGGLFLLGSLGIGVGWDVLWPFIIVFVGLAFWLPIVLWWDRRAQIAGLAIPGTIILTNGLILLYQNLSGDWGSWSYLWTLEPFSVGVGLLMLYLLGGRERGVLVAASIVGGIGLVFFVIFATAFGGILSILGPIALIAVGVLVIISGARQRAEEDYPGERIAGQADSYAPFDDKTKP